MGQPIHEAIVTLMNRRGGLGTYHAMIMEDGEIFIRHSSGIMHDEIPPEAWWKKQFWLIYEKTGILQYHFVLRNTLTGCELSLRAFRGFGKKILDCIQLEQGKRVAMPEQPEVQLGSPGLDEIKRSQQYQRAGAESVDRIAATARATLPAVVSEVRAAAGMELSADLDLAEQVLAIFLFDYFVQNQVAIKVNSPYTDMVNEDYRHFLQGAETRQRSHVTFGEIGIQRTHGLWAWVAAHRDKHLYSVVYGKWFLKELGEIIPDDSVAKVVGGVITKKAYDLFPP